MGTYLDGYCPQKGGQPDLLLYTIQTILATTQHFLIQVR